MLAWLGEWLQGIIAVVLLAIIVELVLPNNKMLRYSRLVIGLILLLTMLNPVLNIFQKDFLSQLSASYSLWEEQFQAEKLKVPSLEEINTKASELRSEREQASEQLTRLGLEDAMKQQLINQGQLNVQDVGVKLGWSKGKSTEQYLYISAITVTVKPQVNKEQDRTIEVQEQIAIEDVTVMIDMNGKVISEDTGKEQLESNGQQSGFHVVQDEQATTIISILTSGWNVNENQIIVQAKS